MKDCEGDINQKGHIVHSVLSARLMEGDCILLIFLLNSAIPEAEYLPSFSLIVIHERAQALYFQGLSAF